MMIMKTRRAKRLGVIALTFVIPESALKKHPPTQLDRHASPATNKALQGTY
jgi:hypothetical protein